MEKTELFVNKGKNSTYWAAVVIDNKMYCSLLHRNELQVCDLRTKKSATLGFFGEVKEYEYLHNVALHVEEEIWFIPSGKNDVISVYDYRINLFTSSIKVPVYSNVFRNYVSAYYVEGYVWLVSAIGSVLRINPSTKELLVFQNDEIEISGSSLVGKKIYMCPYKSSLANSFDLKEMKFEELFSSSSHTGFIRNVSIDKKVFYVPNSTEEDICIYNTVTTELSAIKMKCIGDCNVNEVSTAFSLGNSIYMFVNEKNITTIYVFNDQGEYIGKHEIISDCDDNLYLLDVYQDDKCMVVMPWNDGLPGIQIGSDITIYQNTEERNTLEVFIEGVIKDELAEVFLME